MKDGVVDLDTYRSELTQRLARSNAGSSFEHLALPGEADAVALHLEGVVLFLSEKSGIILSPEDAVRLGVELIQAANLWTVLNRSKDADE